MIYLNIASKLLNGQSGNLMECKYYLYRKNFLISHVLLLFLDILRHLRYIPAKEWRKRICRYQSTYWTIDSCEYDPYLYRDPYCFSVIVRLIVKYDSLYNNKCQFILYRVYDR